MELKRTPLSEVPLHGFDVLEDSWWACSEPERPFDRQTVVDGRCPRCLVGAEAHLAAHGPHTAWFKENGSTSEGIASAEALIAAAKANMEDA